MGTLLRCHGGVGVVSLLGEYVVAVDIEGMEGEAYRGSRGGTGILDHGASILLHACGP